MKRRSSRCSERISTRPKEPDRGFCKVDGLALMPYHPKVKKCRCADQVRVLCTAPYSWPDPHINVISGDPLSEAGTLAHVIPRISFEGLRNDVEIFLS